jgi:hypothetical protein
MKPKPWLLGVGLLGAVLVTPLGPPASASPVSTQAKAAPAVSAFPKLSVVDVKSGKPFKLQSLAATKTPILIWFWAPH